MGKDSKTGACKSASHQLFKDRAKTRLDDLQGMFMSLQYARKESCAVDMALLEEQVNLLLREWQAELNEPSPASSQQQGGSLGFSSDICRLLQLCEEEDDATSALVPPKPDPDAGRVVDVYAPPEAINVAGCAQELGLKFADESKSANDGFSSMGIGGLPSETQLDYSSFEFHSGFGTHCIPGFDGLDFGGDGGIPHVGYQEISPPPIAFLGPKCALWDCPRPALCLDWSQKSDDYCSMYHAGLAPSEGYPGRPPIVRPGGIGLKDNLLFAALEAKALGKNVGIPKCEGAATAKSPWNASELFDLTMLDHETIREWLFFDKPRRAFESGNRKQRSLPDYSGRGWHESRKQVVSDFGGLKRSYYMDPQPMENFEWHLYEYEINRYDSCALYRLEVKRSDGKKPPKGKISYDTVADLQKQMRRLTAEFQNDKPRTSKGRAKTSLLQSGATPAQGLDHVSSASPYLVDNMTEYYHIT